MVSCCAHTKGPRHLRHRRNVRPRVGAHVVHLDSVLVVSELLLKVLPAYRVQLPVVNRASNVVSSVTQRGERLPSELGLVNVQKPMMRPVLHEQIKSNEAAAPKVVKPPSKRNESAPGNVDRKRRKLAPRVARRVVPENQT